MILQRLSGQPFQAFKHWAKDDEWLRSEQGAKELLDTMDTAEFFGDDQEEELLTCLARLTFHLKRERGEDCQAFFRKWDEAYRKVKNEHKVNLPDRYLGFLLVNSLQMSEPEIKAMMAFTRGVLSVRDVKEFVRKHEIKLLTKDVGSTEKDKKRASASTSAIHHIEESDQSENYDEEIHVVESALKELRGDVGDEETEDHDEYLDEEEAAEVLATMLGQRKKTFGDSVKLKKAKELARGFTNWRHGDRHREKGKGRGKASIEELKAVTRCGICKKPGHWHRECPEKGSEKDKNRGKDIHYVQNYVETEEDSFSEAAFCGMLEMETKDDADHHRDGGLSVHYSENTGKGIQADSTDNYVTSSTRTRTTGATSDEGSGELPRLNGVTEPERSFEDHFDEASRAYKDHEFESCFSCAPESEVLWQERHGNPGPMKHQETLRNNRHRLSTDGDWTGDLREADTSCPRSSTSPVDSAGAQIQVRSWPVSHRHRRSHSY